MKGSHEGKSTEIITKVERGDRRALAWGIPTPWLCAVCQEKPQAEGGCAVTERFRETKRKDGREGTVCGGEALVRGAESIRRQKSTGKGGFSQAGEQTLAQNLIVTEEMHAQGCHML